MASGQHTAHHPAGENLGSPIQFPFPFPSPSPSPLLGALTSPSSGISSGPGDNQQAVRFASVNQEIEPVHSLQPYDTTESSERPNTQVLSPETQAELERLSTTLQNVRLQQRRLSNFAFEPVSLPVSRVSGYLPYSAARLYASCVGTVHSSHQKSSPHLRD